MVKEYILFIDSGIGGLSTLSETYMLIPRNYIYFSDNKNCPYGSRTRAEIFEYLKNIIIKVKKQYKVRVVVLACNTATTSAIDSLRVAFPDLTFIGTEPAIKLAADKGYNNILTLCTPLTAKQQKYLLLKRKLKANFGTLSLSDFAENIENYLTRDSLSDKLNLYKDLYFIASKCIKYDAVVLGCTHYAHVSDLIYNITNKPVFDGNRGVAKQVFLTCKNLEIFKSNNSKSNLNILKNVNDCERVTFTDFLCQKNNRKGKVAQTNFDKILNNVVSHNSTNIANLNGQINLKLSGSSEIIFMFSNEISKLNQKYIKTLVQILANKQKLC